MCFCFILQHSGIGGGITSKAVHHFVRRNSFVVSYACYFSPLFGQEFCFFLEDYKYISMIKKKKKIKVLILLE